MSLEVLDFQFEDEMNNSPDLPESPSVDDPYTEDSDLLVSEEIDHQGYHVPRDIDRRLWMQIRHGGNPMLHLMAAYDVSIYVLARCLELNISSAILSTLNDQDWQNLGVSDPNTRQLMIDEFRQIPNQMPCYNSDNEATSYHKVYSSPLQLNTIFTNLLNLKHALSSVVLQMYERPFERVDINGRDYGSSVLLKTLDALSHDVFELELRLSRLQYGAHFLQHMATAAICDRATDPNVGKPRKRNYGKWLALLGTASTIGYCVWRCWRKTAIPAPNLTSYYQPNYLRYHY